MFWPFANRNEIGLVAYQSYSTKYPDLTSLRLQPNSRGLMLAANESGALLLFDLHSDSILPQQLKVIGFEYGGISELIWISNNMIAVGTTRGHIIVFSLQNTAKKLFEICSVKAHGDGAAQVPVQSLSYWETNQRLVSIGQGVSSIHLWDVSDNGNLTAHLYEGSPTAYCEPRFVSFLNDGTELLVGHFEQALVYQIEPWTLMQEQVLCEDRGLTDEGQLGNAILLDDGKLIVFNIKNGCDIYEKLLRTRSIIYEINPCCSQAVSVLKNGSYLAAVSTKGRVNLFRMHDAALIGTLRISGRAQVIHAIESTTKSNGTTFVVASSSHEGKPSRITVWKDVRQQPAKAVRSSKREEYSTSQIIFLCVLVYILCQLVTFLLLPPNRNLALFRGEVSPQSDTPAVSDFDHDAADTPVDIIQGPSPLTRVIGFGQRFLL